MFSKKKKISVKLQQAQHFQNPLKQECIPVGCLWGVSAKRGVCQRVEGWFLPRGCLPQCMLGYTPVDRILDTLVKTLPFRNYVADGKKSLLWHLNTAPPGVSLMTFTTINGSLLRCSVAFSTRSAGTISCFRFKGSILTLHAVSHIVAISNITDTCENKPSHQLSTNFWWAWFVSLSI